jgi:hypothetical protein
MPCLRRNTVGPADRLTRVAAVTTADTIYGIDKVSEHAVLRGLRRTGRSAGRWSW